VTGATGLLGSHVVERLRTVGFGVRALHRPRADTSFLTRYGCELVPGDLQDDVGVLAEGMEGCQALVHAAGEVYAPGSPARIMAVNVDGTRNVFSAASVAGFSRAIHISTVAVYGDPRNPAGEDPGDLPPDEQSGAYGRSKRLAEEIVWGYQGVNGLNVLIFRPTALFGERDRRLVPRVVRMLKRRVVFLPGNGRNRLALSYAGNVAEAVVRGLCLPDAKGDVFNVSEDLALTPRSFLASLGRELGLRPHFVHVPAPLVRILGWLGDRFGVDVPGAAGLSMGRAARLSLNDNPYSGAKARRVLGWAPPFSLDEAMSRTGAWLRQKEQRND